MSFIRKGVHYFGRALRETGQAMDRVGLTMAENEIFRETFTRHRSVMNIYDKIPKIAAGVFVAPNASVIGSVLLENNVSIWYGTIVRGDRGYVRIGRQTNVQDKTVISTNASPNDDKSGDVVIGEGVTIGHGAVLNSCTIGSHSLIGMGAVICEGAEVQNQCIVAAGAVVTSGTLIPSGQLWAGNPAKYIREVTEEEVAGLKESAAKYVSLAETHDGEFLPFGTAYQQAEKMNAI